MIPDPHGHPEPPGQLAPGGGFASAGPGPAATGEPGVLDQAFAGNSLHMLRSAAAAYASQAGLSPARCDDVVVAVHELAANAVRHGAGYGRLRLWRDQADLYCEISDEGPARPAADGQAASGDAGSWPVEFGHGLWLVRAVADRTARQSRDGGTAVLISFAIQPPG